MLKTIRNSERGGPVVLHVITEKGKGHPFTAPNAEKYHALDRCSHSRLSDLRRSAAYMKHRIDNPDHDDTDDTLRGSALHCLLLEPDAFASRYALKDYDGRTKEGKARKAEIEAAGLSPLPVEVWDAAHHSADAIRLDATAKGVLDACQSREKSVLWTEGGVDMKGRPDAFGDEAILDVKSTREASEADFPRFLLNRGVDRQLAMYRGGLESVEPSGRKVRRPYVIACMPDAPHEVFVYRLPESMMEEADATNAVLVARYYACVKSGKYPGGPGMEIVAKRPRWADAVANEDVSL